VTLDWHEHPEARAEFLDAHERYLAIDGGTLGDEFADVVEAAAELILEWPEAPPPYRSSRRAPMIRAWHLGKFPYQLVYTVRDGEILVVAYAHESRRPGYWAHRLSR